MMQVASWSNKTVCVIIISLSSTEELSELQLCYQKKAHTVENCEESEQWNRQFTIMKNKEMYCNQNKICHLVKT